MTTRDGPATRAGYVHFEAMPTRWMDSDAYGHVNNVVYYAFFDTAVARFLISRDVFGPARPIMGLVVETQCRYASPIAFPDLVHAGLRVARLGTSSVRYEIGLFRNDDDVAAAQGHFVHVYVDRVTQRPAPLDAKLRAALETLLLPTP